MKLRNKLTSDLCQSDKFNMHSTSEIIVFYEDDCDSDYIKNFDVELGVGDAVRWVDLRQAFKDHDVITDNFNTRFFEPKDEEDRARGYTI